MGSQGSDGTKNFADHPITFGVISDDMSDLILIQERTVRGGVHLHKSIAKFHGETIKARLSSTLRKHCLKILKHHTVSSLGLQIHALNYVECIFDRLNIDNFST